MSNRPPAVSSPAAAGSISRRDWLLRASGVLAGSALRPLDALATGRRPNVIVILADDLGSRDLGCYGADDLVTPHIDQLARGGLRFDQFYVTAPVCTASRASLLTGRYPQRLLERRTGMIGSEVTLAELLQASGYRTAAFGKWHLGHGPDVSPLAQGFDQFVGFKFGAIDNYSHYYYWSEGARPTLWRDHGLYLESGKYFPDMVTDEAVEFINTNADDPFFLYLPYNVPHYPVQPAAQDFRSTTHISDRARRFYASFVTTLDRCVGRVMEAIEQQDLTRDTIVIFLSDHGHSEEEDSMGGGGSSAPFRGGKMTLLEGGIRVPCIVSWPGTIPEGQVRQQPVMSTDWLPTLAEWCDVPLLGLEIDGHSLRQVIDSPQAPSPHDTLHWLWRDWFAVRRGPWKLLNNEEQQQSLYHLDRDPGELDDQASAQPVIARQLLDSARAWVRRLAQDPRTHPHLPPGVAAQASPLGPGG